MTDAIGQAVKRLTERAKEPKAQFFGLSEDLLRVANALDVIRGRLESLAAAELHRHFNPGEPLPSPIFGELFAFGFEAYQFNADTPLHRLTKG